MRAWAEDKLVLVKALPGTEERKGAVWGSIIVGSVLDLTSVMYRVRIGSNRRISDKRCARHLCTVIILVTMTDIHVRVWARQTSRIHVPVSVILDDIKNVCARACALSDKSTHLMTR